MINQQIIPLGLLIEKQTRSPITWPANTELNRLIAAAVVDQKFRQLLLKNPVAALEARYGSESFCLNATEKALILSIGHTTSLADFALQLVDNYHQVEQLGGIPPDTP